MPVSLAAESARSAEAPPVEFSIDAASLARVLGQFATRARITLSYAPKLVEGRQSPGLRGSYSVVAGLEKLLQGSGLVALAQDDGTYILQPAGQPPGARLSRRQDDAIPAPAYAGTGLPAVSVAAAGVAEFQAEPSAAAKMTASLLDTPRSVTIIPQELISEGNSSSLSEALRSVPGITFKGPDALTSPAGDRPVIRGFDATNSLFVDGLRSIGAQGREMFAVEQVEVVAGPGSVYSGWGGGGGTVNLVSKVPKDENFFAATLGAGSADYARSTLDVNRVINEDTAARLNLMWQDSAKAGRELVTYHRWGVAPSVTFGLDTPRQLTLSYYHLESHDMPDYSVPYAYGGGAPLNVPRSRFYGLLDRDFLNSRSDIAQAEYRLRLDGNLSLRNLTQYSRVQESFIANNPQWAGTDGQTLELEAKSGIFDTSTVANQTELSGVLPRSLSNPFAQRWVAGIELRHVRSSRDAYRILDEDGNSLAQGGSCSVTTNCTSTSYWAPYAAWTGSVSVVPGEQATLTTTDMASLYGLDTFTLNERWSVNAGLRFDHYNTRTSGVSTLSSQQGIWNYQLGTVYKPVPQLSWYASLSTTSNPVGSDVGVGSDLLTETNQDLQPERVRSLEAGLKWELLPQRLSFNAALFHSVKHNARLNVGRYSINGGTQSVNGVELGLRGELSPAWKVFGGFVYLDSKLQDSTESSAFDGKQFPLTPRKSLALWTSYRLAPVYTLGFGATYSDKMYANAANTNFVPAYTKFDAMLAYQLSRNLELQLNLYNLTDKHYYDVAYPVYATVAAGRSAVLTARVKF